MSEAVAPDRPVAALDDAIERMLKVMLRWGEDHRGPSVSWCQAVANVVETLVSTRAILAPAVATSGSEAVSDPDSLVRVGQEG